MPTRRRLAALTISVLAATMVNAAPPEPVDVVSVTSTASALEIVHAPMSDGLRRSLYKLDRSEGFWQRMRASYARDPATGAWRRGGNYDAANRTWTDSDVELGHDYCYRVIVRNDAGDDATGQMTCGVFNGGDATIRPPAPATNVGIVRSEPHLHVLSFTDAADNETGFAVERRATAGLDWVDIANLPASDGTGATLEFADDSVDMEQRYCYRVRTLGEHGNSQAGGACEITPALASVPDDYPGRTRLFVIERPAPNLLMIRWSDDNIDEWTVLLYDPDDLDEPNHSIRVRDRRMPRRLLHGATFNNLPASRLYCVRVVQRGLKPEDQPILCESPHGTRKSNTHVGPAADRLPRPVSLRPQPGGLVLTLQNPRQGQLVDLVTQDGRRSTYLGARNGRDTVQITDLDPETRYCVRPWVFNTYGSRYGEPLCETTLPAGNTSSPGNSVTYTTSMNAEIPNEGVIFYIHVVEPGPPRPAKLLRVRVLGNSFSGYNVRFMRPKPGPLVCSLADGDGVTVRPGSELSGSALMTLFGSETPEIPQTGLVLAGCKLLTGDGLGNTNAIPIDVTYRRP